MHNDVACLAWAHLLRTRVVYPLMRRLDHDRVSSIKRSVRLVLLYCCDLTDGNRRRREIPNDGLAWLTRCLAGLELAVEQTKAS